MKRILCLFLTFIMLLSMFLLSSCSSNGKKPGKNDNGKPVITMWTSHGYDKIREEMKVPSEPQTEYTLYVAKNETENVHIALRTDETLNLLRFTTVSGDNDHIETSIFHVRPVLKRGRKIYTDPTVPMGPATRFTLQKDANMAILVEFKTTADTPAGDYEYVFAVTDNKKNVINTVKITVHVWDFAMPEELTFQTAVGNDGSLDLYNVLLEHNMSGYQLPYDILDSRADAYMSDPRVTSFRIPFYQGDKTDAEILAYYNKIKDNPVWFEKAYFYPIDEPSTEADLKEFERYCKRLKELCPGIKIVSPYYKNIQVTDEMDQIDFMDQYIDLHCPKLANWDEDQIYDANQMAKYPTFDERMKAIQAKGETVWAYVCNYPLAPYLNVKVDDDGLSSRVLFWQMYQRDIDGFLYWSSCYWWEVNNDPWTNVDTFGNGIYGDGILTYPGNKGGTHLPYVPSIRLKIMRDGIDDIELLYLAEDLFGREWVDERVNKVSKSLTSVDVTSDEFAALRVEIGNAIETEMKK